MKEIFYDAAKRGGRNGEKGIFTEDWKEYDNELKEILSTAGYEILYSSRKKKIYIDLPEDIGPAGILVLDKKDLEQLLMIIR